MFYVEHMKKATITLLFMLLGSLALLSCNKRDLNPELSDTIYLDLKNEQEIAEKNLAAEESQYTKVTIELEKVIPQTGQIKNAKKRVFESGNNIDGYRQQLKYFQIAVEIRKNEARSRYLESLAAGGRPWPDQAEIDDYRIRLKLQKEKLGWGKKPEPGKGKSDTKTVPRGTTDGESAAELSKNK